jgi:hypothetical protein
LLWRALARLSLRRLPQPGLAWALCAEIGSSFGAWPARASHIVDRARSAAKFPIATLNLVSPISDELTQEQWRSCDQMETLK